MDGAVSGGAGNADYTLIQAARKPVYNAWLTNVYFRLLMPRISPDRLTYTVSAAVFLFFALMLSVPRGYTVGAVLLLLCSLYYLTQRPSLNLSRQSKWLIFWLLAVFATRTFSTVYHGNPVVEMDLTSRYLLAVPIFLLFLAHPPKIEWVWAGLIVGCISGAGVAWWDLHVLHTGRASGYTGGIQFGNLGLMMGTFCVAGVFWAARKSCGTALWAALLLCGAVAGAYISLASGSRGGWVTLAVVVPIFIVAFLHRENIKWAAAILVGLTAMLVILVATVPSISARYDQAIYDVQQYQQGNTNTSLGARLEIWGATGKLIRERPLLGWGPAEYQKQLDDMVDEKRAQPIIQGLANVHNNYLEVWVFEGFFGLVALVGLLTVALWALLGRLRNANRQTQVMAVCGASMVAAYSVFNLTQNMLERNNTLLFFCVSVVLFYSCVAKKE